MAAAALPTVFINHGGGPCFFMPDDGSGPFPANTWRKMASNLSQLAKLPGPNAPKVKAILVASAHWETEAPAVTVAANPPLLYDYYGFPPETYEIEWLAPGDPDLAQRVKRLLTGAGFPNARRTPTPSEGSPSRGTPSATLSTTRDSSYLARLYICE